MMIISTDKVIDKGECPLASNTKLDFKPATFKCGVQAVEFYNLKL